MTQTRVNQRNDSFVLRGARTRDGFTAIQYATAALLAGTVMSRISASGKLTPFITASLTATDGSQLPLYLLAEDVDATGGDIANVEVYILGEYADYGILFTDGTEDLDSVTTLATGGLALTVREALRLAGIVAVDADDDITGYENA